ncbi:MAG: 16S rRNA (uracil(1498)-N(3))-methyltransferase [Alphaproteobacteria bacterium]|nr:16S rRNA (uracil(1498)-N(3))-methyltransferase [Alphaproteobacteria bacterium]MBE8220193.1 16S rRNA (uracil(1498)-N(3))-methyltransferase [Alphaproteobacteria bacterium]
MSSLQRLYVSEDLCANAAVIMAEAQAHYIRNVMRMQTGDAILLFNGRDGEWRGVLEIINKKQVQVVLQAQTRPQIPASDIWLLVAPVKRARLDYLAQKATEMGVSRLVFMLTHYTDNKHVKLDRIRANTIEAAEQCGLLNIPAITAPLDIAEALALCETRPLIFCDEAQAEREADSINWNSIATPCAVVVGPEGGFSESERDLLYAQPAIFGLRLGRRILRSDTAVVAALTLVQNYIGDWHE